MKTFIASLLFAAAVAEETSITDDAVAAFNDVLNWFGEKTQEHLGSDNEALPFGEVLAVDTTTPPTNGIKAKIALDTTALGVNFVRYEADYYGKAGFAGGHVHLIYFQIEEPLDSAYPADDERFLQTGDAAAAAEEPVVTGQGWWTGMSYAFQVDGTKTPFGMIEK